MKPQEKVQARALRSKGCSIKEIARELGVSRGSVSLWVRDIQLAPHQLADLEGRIHQSHAKLTEWCRTPKGNKNHCEAEQRKQRYRQSGFDRAANDESFRLLCALYWGEGQKTSKGIFGVCNSDPNLLRIVLNWLVANGYDELIGFYVRYHPDNGLSEETIRDWWLARLPRLRESHFRKLTKCEIHRASQRKKIGKLPHGTASLTVCRTELLYTVLGGIDYLIQQGDW